MRGGIALCVGAGATALALYYLYERSSKKRILVVGSINVDLYQRTKNGSITFAKRSVNIQPIKGMTLPASSFVANPKVATGDVAAGGEEAFVLTMDGPFEQKTGGKGANAAAATAQTFACDFLGNMGEASAAENEALLRDLAQFGAVCAHVLRC